MASNPERYEGTLILPGETEPRGVSMSLDQDAKAVKVAFSEPAAGSSEWEGSEVTVARRLKYVEVTFRTMGLPKETVELGMAEIGNQEYEVGAGDFMAFGQKSLPHMLRNPFADDLVYLMGGSRNDIDICDYPKINRRMFRVNGHKTYVDMENLHNVNQKPG